MNKGKGEVGACLLACQRDVRGQQAGFSEWKFDGIFG